MKTIVLCGGKTLGHVTPGISVINELHKKYPMLRIVYLTCDNQIDLKLIKDSSIDKVIYFNLNFKNKLDKIVKSIKYYKDLNKIIKLYKPICIVSFGSILGTLSVLVGKKNKIKTVIHEQNSVMGLGNKLVLRQCDLVLTNYFLSNKYKQVGNPILIENQNIDLIKDKKKLVITSGSNGSLVFSKLGIELYNSKICEEFDITFITGKKYYEDVLKVIKERSNFKIVPFIDNLSNYLWIDIVWGAITPKTNVTNVDNDMETTGMTFGTKRVYYPNNKSITINNIWGSKYSSTNKAIGLIMGYRQLYLSGTTIATDNNIAGWVNISRAYESQNTDTKVFFIYAVYGQKK